MEVKINHNQNPRIKLLFIVTQSEFGGAQRFLHTLISKLDPEIYDMVLATGFQGDGAFPASIKDSEVRILKLKSLARDINPFRDVSAIFEIRNLIKKESPNILFLNSSKAGFVGSLASLGLKTKVIYRIGGWSFRDPGPKWKKWLFKKLEQLSSGWKDYIVVNSLDDANIAKDLNIKPRKKLVLIHNGVDTYKIEPMNRNEAINKLKLPDNKIVVGTIANYYPAKGLLDLVEAASFLKHREDIQFVIIGDGPDRDKIRSKIDSLDIKDKVTLSGRINNASNLMQAFDIFLLSSLKEGFPWAVIEAMASKIPVIATSVGAVPEIIESGKNGIIVEPGQPKRIVEAILYLVDNERVRDELAISGHQTILFKFNQDKMISAFEDLFREATI